MEPLLRTERLTKSYGRRRGVVDLDLEVRPGEVFGFLGPNGAGKTTTIRVLMGLLRPTAGRALVFGLDTRQTGPDLLQRIGYLPGELHLPERVTPRTLLGLFARMHGAVQRRRFDELASRFLLDLDTPIGRLSRGNKQKVGLVQAFMHDPPLLLLDEPTSGLDPLLQEEFHKLVRETKAAGRTVFLSSHNLPEVEELCDRVAIVRDGRLVAVEDVAGLRRRQARRFRVELTRPARARDFERIPGVSEVRVTGRHLACTVTGPPDTLLKALARKYVLSLDAQPPELEDLFLSYYRGGPAR